MRLRLLALLPLAAFAIALLGCQQGASPSQAAPASTDKPASSDSAPPANTQPGNPDDNRAEIPDTLKHDGFLYGGFAPEAAEQTYVVKITGREDSEATTTVRFTGMKDGKAIFERTRQGALADLGSDTVSIDAEGVKVIQMSIGKVTKPVLELPAKIEVGTRWPATVEVETANGKLTQTGTYRVVAEEKVTVPAGTFTAKKVVLEGSATSSAGKATIKGTYWFVENVGSVKTLIEQQMEGGSPATIALELKSK